MQHRTLHRYINKRCPLGALKTVIRRLADTEDKRRKVEKQKSDEEVD